MARNNDKERVPGTAFGDDLIQALTEAVAYERGELEGVQVDRVELTARDASVEPPPPYPPGRIRALRRKMAMSQPIFARVLNASPATVRAWEQGTREPDGPSRRLLQVAERYPESLTEGIVRRKKA